MANQDDAQLSPSHKKRKHSLDGEENDPGDQKKVKTADQDVEVHRPSLMDLSDDVLLCILQHCKPRELKALAFTCERLGVLISDRTLWTRVDMRERPVGRTQLAWFLSHGLHAGTVSVALVGHAKAADGCLGKVNRSRSERPRRDCYSRSHSDEAQPSTSAAARRTRDGVTQTGDAAVPPPETPAPPPGPQAAAVNPEMEWKAPSPSVIENSPPPVGERGPAVNGANGANNPNGADGDGRPYPSRQPAQFFIRGLKAPALPRAAAAPAWPDAAQRRRRPGPSRAPPARCTGPKWTLTPAILRQMSSVCRALTRLRLQYCNINCSMTPIANFPRQIRVLSMRGTRCYNAPLNRSYFFQINDIMPLLEELDLSDCQWLDAAALLPLSKLTRLRSLSLADCGRMGECVAYASLAARYGFRALEVLDLRGTPMGDSEIAAFGYLPRLRELYLAPPRGSDERPRAPSPAQHHHYADEECDDESDIEEWEYEEPEPLPPMPVGDTVFTTLRAMLEGTPEPDISYTLPSILAQRAAAARSAAEPKTDSFLSFNQPSTSRANFGMDRPIPDSANNMPEQEETICECNVAVFESTLDFDAVRDEMMDENDGRVYVSDEDEDIFNVGGVSVDIRSNERANEVRMNEAEVQNKEPIPNPNEIGECSKDAEKRDNNNVVIAEASSSGDRAPRNENMDRQVDREHAYVARVVREAPAAVRVDVRRGLDDAPRPRYDMDNDGRLHVIYVNVRRPINEVVRMVVRGEAPRVAHVELNDAPDDRHDAGNFMLVPSPNNAEDENEERGQVFHLMRMPFIRNIFYGPTISHVNGSALVTDASLYRYGYSDARNQGNYVHIGPDGAIRAGDPPPYGGDRPFKASLEILVCTGYKGVTNRSLNHLATAAPDLRMIDFSDTRVTGTGVDQFLSLRPDCEVICGHLAKETV